MNDAQRSSVVYLSKDEPPQAAYPCDIADSPNGFGLIVTWENHDDIVDLLRRANSVATQISELWRARQGNRLNQEDVDFLVELMNLQAHLSKRLSQVM